MVKITVLVADSQRLFAECLAGMLGRFDDLFALEEYPSSGPEAIEAVKVWRPDITLLDHWIGGMEGPSVIRSILSKAPDSKVLLLSWFRGPDQIQTALEAGAAGYLPKSVSLEQLTGAIREAHEEARPVLVEQLGHLVQRLGDQEAAAEKIAQRLETLTKRELEILVFLSRGGTINEVADKLSISRLTLETHIRNILAKTGARSHTEAVAMALRTGWIQL